MNFSDAISALYFVRNSQLQLAYPITFVSPVVAAMLAAESVRNRDLATKVAFVNLAQSYADNNLLNSALRGNYEFPQRSGNQGVTYTKLTRLATHAEVHMCNTVVNDLIFEQMNGFSEVAVAGLTKVIGELHDNVASHANGTGFSCAQTFCDSDRTRRIQFAIADAGCGMLQNVHRVDPSIVTDMSAIEWCLSKGNTTARNKQDTWAQRLEEDAVVSPFPASVSTFTTDDHHVGEGLWQLGQLIENLQGSLWVLSGIGEYCYKSQKNSTRTSRIDWNGVAIEFEVVIPADSQPSPEQRIGLESLAKRIGL